MKIYISLSLFILFFCSLQAQKPYAVFNHVALEVRNLDKSVAFYSTLFHLEKIPSPWPKRRIAWFKMGEHNQLHIIEADSNEHIITAENFHFCFSVHSMDEFIRLLKKKHIDYDNGYGKAYRITIRADGVKQIYVKDPDGYQVEVNDQVY
jgi:lactoylglutathione lyase